MKHLKYFENTIKDDLHYIIWKDNDDTLVISETKKNLYNTTHCKLLYTYKNEKLKKINHKNLGIKFNIIKNFILYQSDNLKNCLNIISTLSDTNKYNL